MVVSTADRNLDQTQTSEELQGGQGIRGCQGLRDDGNGEGLLKLLDG